jgi:predicted Zn-ribbon and HTH transcriptional regulator
LGCQYEARCRECGSLFAYDDEGGMFFHLVRCDSCGKTKFITFAELGIIHLRYLKGQPVPCGIYGENSDRKMQEGIKLEPISEDEYYNAVEATAGMCGCGGNYSLDAPPRCPNCRSTQIEEGEATVMYD